MSELVIRLGILILIAGAVWLLIWLTQRIIAAQRRQALSAAPLRAGAFPSNLAIDTPGTKAASVRILAFSSDDCRQCHQLQTPALRRVINARGDEVTVVDVDATRETELVQAYHILTVPSTVVLDREGNAHAVNYGFANTQHLLTQIDEILVKLEA